MPVNSASIALSQCVLSDDSLACRYVLGMRRVSKSVDIQPAATRTTPLHDFAVTFMPNAMLPHITASTDYASHTVSRFPFPTASSGRRWEGRLRLRARCSIHCRNGPDYSSRKQDRGRRRRAPLKLSAYQRIYLRLVHMAAYQTAKRTRLRARVG